MDNRPIGVFDSGVGGLTVVNEIRKIMPHEDVIYLGDTARVPYGAKSRETIINYGREIVRFLTDNQVKAIIIACGTVSSNAYDLLCREFDIPLIDVISPGVQACLDTAPSRVGFIATEATIRSGAFPRLISAQKPGVIVYARACPLFVPLVEEGWIDNAVTQLVAEAYLEDWRAQAIDTLVLGCTHYPLLANVIARITGPACIINMAEYTARAAHRLLTEREMLAGSQTAPNYRFYVSGYADKFNRMAQLILGEAFNAEKIDLE